MVSDISHIHIPTSDSVPSASVSEAVSPASKEASEVKTNTRTIILCFDGTGHAYDAKITNVLRLYSLLRKDSKNQLYYYQVSVPFRLSVPNLLCISRQELERTSHRV